MNITIKMDEILQRIDEGYAACGSPYFFVTDPAELREILAAGREFKGSGLEIFVLTTLSSDGTLLYGVGLAEEGLNNQIVDELLQMEEDARIKVKRAKVQ